MYVQTFRGPNEDPGECIPFRRVTPDRFFNEYRCWCLRRAMDHVVGTTAWATTLQLEQAVIDTKFRPQKRGDWRMCELQRCLYNISSPFVLRSRRKKPWFFTELENILAVREGMYILGGLDQHSEGCHAVAVDAYRTPPVMFTGTHRQAIKFTMENLRSMKYPIFTITDVAQVFYYPSRYASFLDLHKSLGS